MRKRYLTMRMLFSGCPRLQFSNSTAYGSNFAVVEVAETHQGGTPLDGERHGAVIKYIFTMGTRRIPSGDFGDFNRYPNALVLYTKEGASLKYPFSSSATEYPQVGLTRQPQNSSYRYSCYL